MSRVRRLTRRLAQELMTLVVLYVAANLLILWTKSVVQSGVLSVRVVDAGTGLPLAECVLERDSRTILGSGGVVCARWAERVQPTWFLPMLGTARLAEDFVVRAPGYRDEPVSISRSIALRGRLLAWNVVVPLRRE